MSCVWGASTQTTYENVEAQQILDRAQAVTEQYAHDSTVFGASLETVAKSVDRDNLYDLRCFDIEGAFEIPDVLLACIGYLKRKDRLKERGLFRVPGDHYMILRLKQEISRIKNEPVTADSIEGMKAEPHSVANVLKNFLKELSEPLLTFDLYAEFISLGREEKALEGNNEAISRILDKLPPLNKNITWFLLAFLAEVSQYEEYTQMSLECLAVLFAPNLLRPRNETFETLMQDADPKKAVAIMVIRLAKEYTKL